MNSSYWFISNSEIRPGATAVLGGNMVAFLVIHILAIFFNFVSIICCVIIITHILLSQRKSGLLKLEMSLRFQIYFGVGDIIFAIIFSFEHSYLLVTQTLLETKSMQIVMGLLIVIPFAWTHFFRCAVSIFAYMKIVKDMRVNLGYWEWKVHLSVILIIIILAVFYSHFDMVGCCGYWSAYNATTTSGLLGAFFVCLLLFWIAAIYLFCYLSIKRRVILNRKRLHSFNPINQENFQIETREQQAAVNRHIINNNYHPTTLKCLTTHVRIGIWIYCPLAIFISWHVFIQFKLGVTSPVLSGIIVVVASSNGWANALGYFQNERIKKNRIRTHILKLNSLGSSSERENTVYP